MKKYNLKNEQIKRRYFGWLKDAEGFSPSTIGQIVRSISLWEDHVKAQDFRDFDVSAVKAFKKMLQEKTNAVTKQPLSVTTLHHHLVHLSEFYKWLSMQPGYKSKIGVTDAAYFQMDRKQTRIALHQPKRRTPTIDIIKKVVASIGAENEIDRRDQALMAFAFLTGMRIDAIISTPLGCIDTDSMKVSQNPTDGVRTKYAKTIPTTIFNFDESLVTVIKEWIGFLRKDKLFTDQDPLFPATTTEQEGFGSYCFTADKLGSNFWKNTNSARMIFKKRLQAADLGYFNPHSFRRAAINIALSLCKTPAEFKAVSQNLGHENIATTMFDYAVLPEDEVERHVRNLTKKKLNNKEEIAKMIAENLDDYDISPKQ
jgi:integrase